MLPRSGPAAGKQEPLTPPASSPAFAPPEGVPTPTYVISINMDDVPLVPVVIVPADPGEPDGLPPPGSFPQTITEHGSLSLTFTESVSDALLYPVKIIVDDVEVANNNPIGGHDWPTVGGNRVFTYTFTDVTRGHAVDVYAA